MSRGCGLLSSVWYLLLPRQVSDERKTITSSARNLSLWRKTLAAFNFSLMARFVQERPLTCSLAFFCSSSCYHGNKHLVNSKLESEIHSEKLIKTCDFKHNLQGWVHDCHISDRFHQHYKCDARKPPIGILDELRCVQILPVVHLS